MTAAACGGHFVFDLAESADIPKYSEPMFMLGCLVKFCPVMNLEDLMKGLAATK